MSYSCEIREQTAQATLAIRTRSAVERLPEVFGQSIGAIFAYLGELGEGPAGVPYAAYYNMDMQDLDIEIGLPVTRVLPGRGTIQPSQLPGGKAATYLHTGPYNELGAAYDALNQFILDQGLQATGVAYEIYLGDPSQTPPQELQTLILFPLK